MELAAATLANAHVRLEPFEPHHRDGVVAAARADLTIFRHMPFPLDDGYAARFDWLCAEQAAGRWIAHAVIAKSGPMQGQIIGQSCYLTIRPEHDGVEIGGTWYRREAQGTAINPAAKLL